MSNTDFAKRSEIYKGKRTKKAAKKANSSNSVPVPKNSRKDKKRVGQGPGSGMGKTSTRGQKGQRARASSMRPGFEGGQMRLSLRMPKRGFTNIFKTVFQPVNLSVLAKLNLSGEVTPALLEEKGLIKSAEGKVKFLGSGELKSALKLVGDAISYSAKEKLEKAGGSFSARTAEKKTKE